MPTFDQNNTFSSTGQPTSYSEGRFERKPVVRTEIPQTPTEPNESPDKALIDSLRQQIQVLRQQLQTQKMQGQVREKAVEAVRERMPQGPQPMNQPQNLKKPIPGNRVKDVEKRILASGVKPNPKQLKTLQGLGLLNQAPKLSKFQQALNGEYQ